MVLFSSVHHFSIKGSSPTGVWGLTHPACLFSVSAFPALCAVIAAQANLCYFYWIKPWQLACLPQTFPLVLTHSANSVSHWPDLQVFGLENTFKNLGRTHTRGLENMQTPQGKMENLWLYRSQATIITTAAMQHSFDSVTVMKKRTYCDL